MSALSFKFLLVVGIHILVSEMLSTFLTSLCLQEFNRQVLQGFQVTPLWNQGFICDDGRYLLCV